MGGLSWSLVSTQHLNIFLQLVNTPLADILEVFSQALLQFVLQFLVLTVKQTQDGATILHCMSTKSQFPETIFN